MFDVHESFPICHDLGEKHRTSDVLFGEKVTFSSLLLKEEVQKGLTKCGYVYLSPIQRNALPIALTGRSIIAHAKSGTGKTLVYCLSALNNVLEKNQKNLQCLILSPTREIAKQIYDVFKNVGYYIPDLKVEYFIGGTPLDLDVLKCNGCQVAIGAPGRIKHLIELGELIVSHVQMLVLDEVDALLCNKEFAIRELVSHLPSERQTIVCTATFSDNIKQLLDPISPAIKYVTVNEPIDNENNHQITSNILIGIKQFVAPVFCDSTSLDAIRKRNKLMEILRNFKYDQCFVFVNYVTIAKGLCNMLVSNNFPALWVSSEQNQSTRISTLNKLKLNQCNILVTTDLAARGIDVHNVNLVINMGIPSPPDVYIHRMGRAGRYGSEGAVITILHEGYELEQFYKVVSSVSTDPVDLFVLPNEISINLQEVQLEKIHCKPDPNALPNVNEYQFKKNNENRANTGCNNKSKKSKHRNKSKKFEYLPENLESISVVKDDGYIEEIVPANVTIDKEMENIILHYIEGIREEINRENIFVDESNLRNLFQPSENNIYAVQYSNFFKPTFIEVPDRNEDEDDDVFIQTVNDTCLIQYMRYIKRKHVFLDEQKLPCSTAQFLELAKSNGSLIRKLAPADAHDSVQDILEKIRIMLAENRRKQSVSTSLVKPAAFGNRTNNTSKRIIEPVKLTPPKSLDTTDHIKRETSTWMISCANYSSRQYLPKYAKNQDFTVYERDLTDSLDSHSDSSYTVFRSSRNNLDVMQTDCDNDSYRQSTRQKFSHIATSSKSIRENNIHEEATSRLHSGYITCPNCQYSFISSKQNNVSFLPPIKSLVDENTESRIWQHHFNFINSKVSSRSSIPGNR